MFTNETLNALPVTDGKVSIIFSVDPRSREIQDDIDAAFADEFSDEVEIPEYVYFEKIGEENGLLIYRATFSLDGEE